MKNKKNFVMNKKSRDSDWNTCKAVPKGMKTKSEVWKARFFTFFAEKSKKVPRQKIKKILIFNLFFFYAINFTFSWGKNSCPYKFNEASVYTEKIEGLCDYAAAIFRIENVSAKKISELTLCFNVTDSEGNNPFAGGNAVKILLKKEILSGIEEEVVFEIDSYLDDNFDIDLCLKEVFVQKVVFEDGSFWEDKFGIYSIDSE